MGDDNCVRMDPGRTCETCALGGGHGAAGEITNRLKATVAAAAGVPFFCHHSRSGPEYDWRSGGLGPLILPPTERRLCAGWKVAVAERWRKHGPLAFMLGNSPDALALRGYCHHLGNEAIAKLDALDSATGEDRARLIAELGDLVRALGPASQ